MAKSGASEFMNKITATKLNFQGEIRKTGDHIKELKPINFIIPRFSELLDKGISIRCAKKEKLSMNINQAVHKACFSMRGSSFMSQNNLRNEKPCDLLRQITNKH